MIKIKSSFSSKYVSLISILIILLSLQTTNAQNLKQTNNTPLALLHSLQTPQTGIAEKTATVFGQKIVYQEAGSATAPVIVLLHGLGGNSTHWATSIAPLAEKYRVIVPDQIGFGKSDKPFISYRIGTYVDFLDAFLTQLKIEKATVAGISLGGWIAAHYTITYPKRVEKLVLVDAAGFAPPKDFDPKFFQNLFPTTRAQVKQSLSLILYNTALINDAIVDGLLAQRFLAGDGYTIQQIIESVKRNEDYVDGKARQIKQPTLIIWGKQDKLILPVNGERYKRLIAGSQLVIIDQAGHAPNLEKAAEFNAALLKFLTGTNQ